MSKGGKSGASRAVRLKQALKANMARRKAQAKARAAKITKQPAVTGGKEGKDG